MLLPKGFEVEMYTGTPDGNIIGLSDRIVADLDRFTREPDNRNVEYTTPPLYCYEQLLCELVRPRVELRRYLQTLGDYTLIPGSTLACGDSRQFFRSDPQNPYHSYIEATYGTSVVTASIHINIGIPDTEVLMRALRLVRLEAPLFLALSASSPFLDHQMTGQDSSRWALFPQVPSVMPPLFESHAHFIRWTNEQLDRGTMQNVRHLWIAARPNGNRRPYDLNRLELRICDLVVDPIALLAITALLEARLWQLLEDPNLDPLLLSHLPSTQRADGLLELIQYNEQTAARSSLDAKLIHWQDGREILARDWIQELLDSLRPIARQHGLTCFLSPIQKILREGNSAQQWMHAYHQGASIPSIIQTAIQQMEQEEADLAQKICQPAA